MFGSSRNLQLQKSTSSWDCKAGRLFAKTSGVSEKKYLKLKPNIGLLKYQPKPNLDVSWNIWSNFLQPNPKLKAYLQEHAYLIKSPIASRSDFQPKDSWTFNWAYLAISWIYQVSPTSTPKGRTRMGGSWRKCLYKLAFLVWDPHR